MHSSPVIAMPPPTPANTTPALREAPAVANRAKHNEAAPTSTHALAIPAIDRQAIHADHVEVQPIRAVVAATSTSPVRNNMLAVQGSTPAVSAPAQYPRQLALASHPP